jgi:hypothetical protein
VPGGLRRSRKSGGFLPGAVTSVAKSDSFSLDLAKKRHIRANCGARSAPKHVKQSPTARRGQPPQEEFGGGSGQGYRFVCPVLKSLRPAQTFHGDRLLLICPVASFGRTSWWYPVKPDSRGLFLARNSGNDRTMSAKNDGKAREAGKLLLYVPCLLFVIHCREKSAFFCAGGKQSCFDRILSKTLKTVINLGMNCARSLTFFPSFIIFIAR